MRACVRVILFIYTYNREREREKEERKREKEERIPVWKATPKPRLPTPPDCTKGKHNVR